MTAIAAALLPIDLLGDRVSLGAACAFAMVCLSVFCLRRLEPDPPRPFRAPGGMWTPIVKIVASLGVVTPVLLDMIDKARRGDMALALILIIYLVAGAVICASFRYRRSRLPRATAEGSGQ